MARVVILLACVLCIGMPQANSQNITVTLRGSGNVRLGTIASYEAIFSSTKPPAWADYWWEITGGRINPDPAKYTPTSCEVIWDTPGAGMLKLVYLTTQGHFRPELSIAINGTSAPATPRPGFTTVQQCNSTTVTRSISPAGAAYEWYWQTSPDGTSTTLGSGPSITLSEAGPVYLRARHTAAPNLWSDVAQPAGTIEIIASPPSSPGAVADMHVIAPPGDIPVTISVPAVTGATSYAWYTQATGGTALPDMSSNSHTVSVTQSTSFYVAALIAQCASARTPLNVYRYTAPVITGTNGGQGSPSNPVVLSVTGDVVYDTYEWLDDTDTPIPGATGPAYTTQVAGAYKVRVQKATSGLYTSEAYTVRNVRNTNMNYVVTNTVQLPGITTRQAVGNLPAMQKQQGIEYFDGIGRPVQTVVTQGSPALQDVVVPTVYDTYGRQTHSYLPVAVGNDGAYKPNTDLIDRTTGYYKGVAASFYAGGSGDVASDSRPFNEVVLEASPIDRKIKEFGPGNDWYTQSRAVQYNYRAGTAGDKIVCWKVDAAGMPVRRAGAELYSDGELYVTQTTDEHGTPAQEYKDKLGRVVLKRMRAKAPVGNPNTAVWADTYYVYDDFGLLRLVLPPELSAVLAGAAE